MINLSRFYLAEDFNLTAGNVLSNTIHQLPTGKNNLSVVHHFIINLKNFYCGILPSARTVT